VYSGAQPVNRVNIPESGRIHLKVGIRCVLFSIGLSKLFIFCSTFSCCCIWITHLKCNKSIILYWERSSDGSRSKFFDLGQNFIAHVWLGQPSLVWVWKISSKNLKFINFFPSDQKKSPQLGSKSTRDKDWSASFLVQV